MQKGVLLGVKNKEQREQLKKSLTTHGYKIIAEVDDAYSALRCLQNKKVSLSLIDYEINGLNGLQLAQVIADEDLGPVVLISQHYVDTGFKAPPSLFGVLLKPITQYQLINTINLALTQYQNQRNLAKEVEKLKENLESRKVIEKAKGILMRKNGLSEEEAYNKLRTRSMEKRISMKKVAEAIILMDEF